MKNKIVSFLFVFTMLVSCNINAQAAEPAYNTSPLKFNPQIYELMYGTQNPSQTEKTNSPNKIKTTTYTKNISSPENNTSSQPAVSTQITNPSEKDLQIEGRIEKSQKQSLYQNQSAAELQQMVDGIGKKIIKANSLKNSINFKYDESDVANANTNISNTVRVYKGLIKYCEDYDELAYVIGHEIGHATSHHVIKGVAVRATGAVASTAATIAVESKTKNTWAALGVGAATEIIAGLGEKKVSRTMETNADLLSIDYVVKAGYNPLASIAIMNKIGENYVDFWADHPSTDKRVVMMYNYIKEKYPQYLEKGFDSAYYDKALEDYIFNEDYNKRTRANEKAIKQIKTSKKKFLNRK